MSEHSPKQIQKLVDQYFSTMLEDGVGSLTLWEAGEKLLEAGTQILPPFFERLETIDMLGNPTAVLISRMGRDAIPFIENLKTKKPAVRYYVYEGFVKIATEEDIPFLIKRLWDTIPSIEASSASKLISFEKISMKEVGLLLEELDSQIELHGEQMSTHGVFRVHGNWIKKAAKEEHIPFLLAGLDHPLRTIAWHNALRLSKFGPRDFRDLKHFRDILKRWEHEGKGQNRPEFYELLLQWRDQVSKAATGGAFVPKPEKKKMPPPNNIVQFRKPGPKKGPLKH